METSEHPGRGPGEPVTWVEVSGAALRANLRSVAAHARVPVCAVVKANAYGHGLAGAAQILAAAGAEMLAVTRVEEAQALRRGGIPVPILILTPPADPARATALGCAITVGSLEEIERLPPTARVHLKVDTGMGRLGVRPEETVDAARRIDARANLEAVWTHFADAAGPGGRRQLDRFLGVRSAVRDAGLECRFHAANSAATLTRPEARLDLVRVGTLLYGEHPVGARAPFALEETFRWFARVVAVRDLPRGATVGYGSEWRAGGRARVATLPVGYADGFGAEPLARTESLREAFRRGGRVAATVFGRRPSPRAVWFGGERAPAVGRIAMQVTTVRIDGIGGVDVGSVARIPARRLLVNPTIERVYH